MCRISHRLDLTTIDTGQYLALRVNLSRRNEHQGRKTILQVYGLLRVRESITGASV
jgi:hypothetical protein